MSQIKNKIALVTGASRGIGAEAALILAQNGYDVVVNYLNNKEKAEEVVKSAQKNGVKAIAIKADLADENQIIKMFEEIDKKLGKVSALVNNGGISGGIKSIEEIDFKYLETVYKPNVFGTFICCREAIKRMKEIGSGTIVNISSLSAKMGGFKMSAYSSSKAAINNLTIGLAKEVAENNIRINAVSPGVIDTDTHLGISKERLTHLQNSIPMKRMGLANEVAETILWLVSDRSSYITGSIIDVTGGK